MAVRPDVCLIHAQQADIYGNVQHLGPPFFDAMLSFCASAEDPISGGRHKVLGSASVHVPPPDHHRDVTGGALRAGVFGAMDGLVSNFSLVAGVIDPLTAE